MLTPRQKKIVILLVGIIIWSGFQLVSEYKEYRDRKQRDERRQSLKAEEHEQKKESIEQRGTTLDPDSPLGQAVQEYREKQEREKLEQQAKNNQPKDTSPTPEDTE